MVVSLITDTAGGGDAEGDELNSIENLTGSAHDDHLWGNDGVNVLTATTATNALKGFGCATTRCAAKTATTTSTAAPAPTP